MKEKYASILSELDKYKKGVHILNPGADESTIGEFEEKYSINVPASYREWLKKYNGGEFFALPVGTTFSGILGNSVRDKGCFYLEDNFIQEKRVGLLSNLFVIGEQCDGEIVAFDLTQTTLEDGHVVLFDVETAEITEEWCSFFDWLKSVFEEGKAIFDYEGLDR